MTISLPSLRGTSAWVFPATCNYLKCIKVCFKISINDVMQISILDSLSCFHLIYMSQAIFPSTWEWDVIPSYTRRWESKENLKTKYSPRTWNLFIVKNCKSNRYQLILTYLTKQIVWIGNWRGSEWSRSSENRSRSTSSPFSSPVRRNPSSTTSALIRWSVAPDANQRPFRL